MSMSLTAFGSRILSVATVAALSGVAASCSLAEKQLFTGSTPNQREIIGTAAPSDQPLPAPTTTVTRADLPPPPGTVAASATAPATPVVPATTVGSNGVTYAWSAVGGSVATVGLGENLDTIALK